MASKDGTGTALPIFWNSFCLLSDLPFCVQILFELPRIQHLISDDTPLLQRGNVLADSVVKLWVVAFGEQFVNLFPEALNLLELMDDGVLLLFRLCAFFAEQVRLAVAQRRLALFNRDRLEGKELVATPLVDDDEGIESLTRPGGDVPDKRGLRQGHEEVQVIGEISKKVVVDVVVDLLAKNGRESIAEALQAKSEKIASVLSFGQNVMGKYEFNGKEFSPVELTLEV